MTADARPRERVEPPAGGRPWTALHLVRWSAVYLQDKGVPGGRLDAEHLLADVLGVGRLELYLQHDRPLTREELDGFRLRLLERARRKPLQYILGRAAFRDLELRVDERVLIPRPETEVLVEEVLRWARVAEPGGSFAALDVGTGSGAIALALATEGPFERVLATDVSPRALEVARENARRVGDPPVEFRCGSLLEPVREGERFDVVVSNPPYVSGREHDALEPEVREWEPRDALVSGEAGTEILMELVRGSGELLRPGGLLALETGEGQASEIARRIRALGIYRDPMVREDLAGKERILLAERAGTA